MFDGEIVVQLACQIADEHITRMSARHDVPMPRSKPSSRTYDEDGHRDDGAQMRVRSMVMRISRSVRQAIGLKATTGVVPAAEPTGMLGAGGSCATGGLAINFRM